MSDDSTGSDHGLGEVVDPTTAIADTGMVESEARNVEAKQRVGWGYWSLATAALVLLGEQAEVAYVLFALVLSTIAIHVQIADVIWLLTVFTLASAVLSPLMTKLGDQYGRRNVPRLWPLGLRGRDRSAHGRPGAGRPAEHRSGVDRRADEVLRELNGGASRHAKVLLGA